MVKVTPTVLWLPLFLALLSGAPPAHTAPIVESTVVDHVVVRWRAPGESRGHAIFARELAFEARIEALALGEDVAVKLADRHVRAALARHVTEALLETLPLEPAASATEIARRADLARTSLEVRVGGAERLAAARRLEGISADELSAMLRRSARASLYLDRMVAPQVEPSDVELRELHAAGKTPYSTEAFVDCVERLRRWVVAQRLSAALEDFWQRTRTRLVIRWAVPRTAEASSG